MKLRRVWKSVDYGDSKSDHGKYKIWQTNDEKEIFILGKGKSLFSFKNIGYGKSDTPIDVGSKIYITWINFNKNQGSATHKITLEVKSEKEIRRFKDSSTDVGYDKSYGNWDAI